MWILSFGSSSTASFFPRIKENPARARLSVTSADSDSHFFPFSRASPSPSPSVNELSLSSAWAPLRLPPPPHLAGAIRAFRKGPFLLFLLPPAALLCVLLGIYVLQWNVHIPANLDTLLLMNFFNTFVDHQHYYSVQSSTVCHWPTKPLVHSYISKFYCTTC